MLFCKARIEVFPLRCLDSFPHGGTCLCVVLGQNQTDEHAQIQAAHLPRLCAALMCFAAQKIQAET